MDKQTNARIAELNDRFRKQIPATGPVPGLTVCTSGVQSAASTGLARLLEVVAAFDSFDTDNDPFGEHDLGSFEFGGEKLFWKINHYADDTLSAGDEDPSNPTASYRVLTIMLASEY